MNQFWFSKVHTLKGNEEQLYTSHRQIYHPSPALLRRQYVIHYPFFNEYPRIQLPPLLLPQLGLLRLLLLLPLSPSRSFLNRIKALILSTNAAKMLCTYDPPFFFVLLVGFRSC